jgi:hypothetical protein
MNFNPESFYIVRAEKAGVFMVKIKSTDGSTFNVTNARRLYYWSGALDVTQLAADGVTRPKDCKFSVQMGDEDQSTIFQVIECHPVSEKALKSINSVPVWKQ